MSNQRCERRFHVTGLDFFGKTIALGSQDPFDEILVAAKFRSVIAANALEKIRGRSIREWVVPAEHPVRRTETHGPELTDGLEPIFFCTGQPNAVKSFEVMVVQTCGSLFVNWVFPEVLSQQLPHLWLRCEREGMVYLFDPIAVHPIDLFVVEIPLIHIPQIDRGHERKRKQREGGLELIPGHGGNHA